MNYCKICGGSISDTDKFCSNCGTTIERDDYTKTFTSNYKQNRVSENGQSKYHVASTVLGILAVVLSGLNYLGVYFVHIFGIALGGLAIGLALRDKKTQGKYSKTGLYLGIAGVLLGVLAVIIGIIIVFVYFS